MGKTKIVDNPLVTGQGVHYSNFELTKSHLKKRYGKLAKHGQEYIKGTGLMDMTDEEEIKAAVRQLLRLQKHRKL